MNTEEFLLETFKSHNQVTVNAIELQKLLQAKRALERKKQTKQTQIVLLEAALASSKSKYNELYEALQALEHKLDMCDTVYTVDLKV